MGCMDGENLSFPNRTDLVLWSGVCRGDAISASSRVIYDKKLPVAIVQAVEWRIFKFLRIAKIVRGPLFLKK